METERYSRQIAAFGSEGQRAIESSRVGIVGLGGLGSHVAQGLAHLGVQEYILVDHDVVDVHSLNRLPGTTPADSAAHTLKVQVAERTIMSVQPSARVRLIPRSLRSGEAMRALVECRTIFGCVDNDLARMILTELSSAYEIALIDSATEFLRDGSRLIDVGGRVAVATPGTCCLLCLQALDREEIAAGLESSTGRAIREAHGYGLRRDEGPAPSVISLNGVIAYHAITEFLALTTRFREPNPMVTYHATEVRMTRRILGDRPKCYICDSVMGTRERADVFRYVSE